MLACAAAAAPAGATAPPRLKEARFKATVEGVQTTTWTANHPSTSRCDTAYHGSGSERVRFKSRKAVKVKALSLFGGRALFTGTLPTRGSVKRTGTLNRAPVVPECAVGDGGGPSMPPPEDCGTKRIPSLPLMIAYDPLKKNRLTVRTMDVVDEPRFQQCPLMGEGWNTIIDGGEKLPPRDLFDRRQGKMILIGKGRETGGSQGVRYTTKIKWELTLTRLR